MTLPLIDKQDTFEIIRDQISLILANEVANQKVLATTANKNPKEWDLKIYAERTNPWDEYQDADSDDTPVVNVWFETETFERASSNVIDRQKAIGVFNIDCYGFAVSESYGPGHKAGDELAALKVHKAVKLVRNILMASENTYLKLPRGVAWDRILQSITIFQPTLDGHQSLKIVAARLTLNVSYNEFSPQFEGENLESISIDITKASDGQILAEADFDYPIT